MTEVDEIEYFAVAAKRTSVCPHCPEEIQPGDAIVRRPQDPASSHHRCAIEQDEIDADPAAAIERQRAEWESKRQASIDQNLAQRPRPGCSQQTQRRAHAA